jgi:hypothetical protein
LNDGCLNPERLDQLVESSEARAHAERCPRCHELLASYDQFQSARSLAGSDADDAAARLGVFLDQLPHARVASPRRSLPRLRWALPAAAVAAGALFFLLPRATEIPDRAVLREEGPSGFALLSPQTVEEGWILRWNQLDGADSYELRLYSTSLNELRRIGPIDGTETTLAFPDEEGLTWLWRVIALRNGDEIGQTDVGTLTH